MAVLSAPFYSWQVSSLCAIFAAYFVLCLLLRFRRIKNVQSLYGFNNREALSRMTNEDAHDIANTLIYWEFPTIYEFGVRVALFTVCYTPR